MRGSARRFPLLLPPPPLAHLTFFPTATPSRALPSSPSDRAASTSDDTSTLSELTPSDSDNDDDGSKSSSPSSPTPSSSASDPDPFVDVPLSKKKPAAPKAKRVIRALAPEEGRPRSSSFPHLEHLDRVSPRQPADQVPP
ncbi:hypothetical protein JCM6882_008689 [Rhodosporidiobolus microsporus]